MKKKYARLVDVPKVERSAYNHARFISGLVMHQLIHLSTVEQSLPVEHRTGINISTLHTEKEAADYIGQVTAKLHQLKGKPPKKTGKRRAVKGRLVKKRSSRSKPHGTRGKRR